MQKYTKVFFGLLLVSAFLPAVALASSLTSGQIQSIINLLQSFGADSITVANVQSALNGGSSMPVQYGIYYGIPAGFAFNRNLGMGSSGQDVSYLKIILTSENCFWALTSNTGFGPLTQAGVRCFQSKYGISSDGTVGAATMAKLNYLLSSTSEKSCSTDADCPQVEATATTFPSDRCINGRCVLQQGNCIPNWTCGWGPCTNGYQSETAVDSNNCGLSSSNANIACPALAKACDTTNSITISSVYGPNSLNIGQTGTWNVSATAPGGTSLNYSVDWGDTVYPVPMTSGSANTNISQTSTFTHSYSQAGTYTVKFTVSSPSVCATGIMFPCIQGGSATTSITVQVVNATPQSSGIILFYGQGCPHCTNVDNYLASNNIAQKVDFQELETFYNITNNNLMNSKAVICGLTSGSIGVPLLWDGNKCYVGDTDIINFFSKYVSVQPSITVISPGTNEPLRAGLTYYILWNSSGLNASDDVSISLYTNTVCPMNVVGCQSNYSIPIGPVQNSGSYRWDTSAKMGGSSTGPNSITVVPGYGYRIKICDGSICGYSNYFNIVTK